MYADSHKAIYHACLYVFIIISPTCSPEIDRVRNIGVLETYGIGDLHSVAIDTQSTWDCESQKAMNTELQPDTAKTIAIQNGNEDSARYAARMPYLMLRIDHLPPDLQIPGLILELSQDYGPGYFCYNTTDIQQVNLFFPADRSGSMRVYIHNPEEEAARQAQAFLMGLSVGMPGHCAIFGTSKDDALRLERLRRFIPTANAIYDERVRMESVAAQKRSFVELRFELPAWHFSYYALSDEIAKRNSVWKTILPAGWIVDTVWLPMAWVLNQTAPTQHAVLTLQIRGCRLN